MYEYISLLYSYLTRAIFVPIIVVLYSYPPNPKQFVLFSYLICNRTIFVPYLIYISCHIRTHYSRTLFVPSQSQTIRPLFVPWYTIVRAYSYLTYFTFRAIFVPIIVVLHSYPPNPKQFALFSYLDIQSYHIRTFNNLHSVPYSYPIHPYSIGNLPYSTVL